MQKNDPILINIPHSSTYIPPEEAGYFTKGYQKIKKDIEELLDILGHYSR